MSFCSFVDAVKNKNGGLQTLQGDMYIGYIYDLLSTQMHGLFAV